MKRSLHYFAIVALFLLFSSTKLYAVSKNDTINGIIYTVSWRLDFPEDKYASVTGYTSFFSGIANFLSSVEGAPVISVGGFRNCTRLTSVNIPSSVTRINDYAFEECNNLTSVTIGDSVTNIGGRAFDGCNNIVNLVFYPRDGHLLSVFNTINLKYLAIGKDVEYIPNLHCPKLESIAVNGANLNYDSRENCNAIIQKSTNKLILGCSNTFIPNSVTSIGNSAFYDCIGLTDIIIPNGVTTIEGYAFYGCVNLQSITIPYGITTIEESAFSLCAPKVLTWNAKHCENKGGMTTTEIEHVYIGHEVDYIPNYFVSGSKITELNLPNSVTVIGAYAFSECIGLTSLTIPESLLYTGVDAFGSCSNITELYFNAKTCSQFNYHFDTYSEEHAPLFNLEKVVIGPEVEWIPMAFLSYCPKVQKITIPNSVTRVFYGAFLYCTGLAEVDMPNSVKYINEYAFRGCSNLTKINIPNSVTSIEYTAFCECSSLSSITIPQSVDTIGRMVFLGCNSLKRVYWNAKNCTYNPIDFANNNPYDNFGPFASLGNHFSVIIGPEVESIGSFIFYNKSNELDTVTCYATTPPACGNEEYDTFDTFNLQYNSCIYSVLRVPESAIDAYRNKDIIWGWFKTIEPIPSDEVITITGDVDGDGRVSIEDVTSLISILLKSTTSSTTGADVNADGYVNIEDVTTLINMLLRGGL